MTFSEGLIQQNIALHNDRAPAANLPADESLAALFRVGLDDPILWLHRVRT